MTPTPILSEEQKQRFIRDGYIVMRGLIPEDVARGTHAALLAELETERGRQQSGRHANTQVMWGAGKLTEACRSEAVEQVIDELVGPHLRTISYHPGKEGVGLPAEDRGFIPVLTHPNPRRAQLDKKFIEPQGWHVDGINGTAIMPTVLMMVVFAYLNDVPEYGGATVVKPGSHRQLFEYWTQRGEVTPVHDLDDQFAPSLPLTGKAGDVIFFHYLLNHSGSDNLTEHIRVGINTAVHQDPNRPYRPRQGEPDETWTPFDWTLRTDNLNPAPEREFALSEAAA